MTGAGGVIEFFVLEASEYIEQLDGLLLGAGSNEPDVDSLQRLSRALRGSATMAKLQSFAGLAAAIERVGRALREGEVRWDPALRAALISAIDDMRTLLRSARTWTVADDQRAAARVAELTLFAPPRTSGAFRPPGERASGGAQRSPFLGGESANIAAGLELLTTRVGDRQTAANVVGRIRALRGVAEVKEAGPLADVLEAAEEAAHGLEAGGSLSAEAKRVLESATTYLRALTPALKGSGSADAPSPARNEFLSAVSAWRAAASNTERVVPISELFYEDGSPGVVNASANPPTSPQARFRLEMVSMAEHLRGVIDSARHASDPDSIARNKRELGRALGALKASAESFGEREVAMRIASHADTPDRLDAMGLSRLESLASELATAAPSQAEAKPTPTQRVPTPSPVRAQPEVSENRSAELIDTTIAALDRLNSTPMIEPSPIPEDLVVPIETLLYRGRAALERAVAIRDELRRGGPPDPVALEELFDLVGLARVE